MLRAFLDSSMAEAVTKTPVLRRVSEDGGDAGALSCGVGGACRQQQQQHQQHQLPQLSAAAAFVRAVDRPFFMLH